VPVILVHYDIFTTIEKISETRWLIRSGDRRGIEIARKNVERYSDWAGLWRL
jgi:hypothetical protein